MISGVGILSFSLPGGVHGVSAAAFLRTYSIKDECLEGTPSVPDVKGRIIGVVAKISHFNCCSVYIFVKELLNDNLCQGFI